MRLFNASLVVATVACSLSGSFLRSVTAFVNRNHPSPAAAAHFRLQRQHDDRRDTCRRSRKRVRGVPLAAASPRQFLLGQKASVFNGRVSVLLQSSRTVDAEVVEVIDVSEEERREEQERRNADFSDIIGRIGGSGRKGRPTAEIAKDVRVLLEEAVQLVREAGPRSVGARGLRASRCVELVELLHID